MKLITSAFLLLLFAPLTVSAADVSVTCDNNDCVTNPPNEPLFSETNLVPGQTVTKIFQVKNEGDESCGFTLNTADEDTGQPNLAARLHTVIRNDGDRFGVSAGDKAADDKSMNDLFNSSPIDLGPLASGADVEYQWIVTFDKTADNDYQGKETSFDFDMNFTCDGGGEVAGDENGNGDGDGESDTTSSSTLTLSPSPSTSPGMTLGAQDTNTSSKSMIKGILDRFPTAGEKGRSILKQKDWHPAQVIILLILAAITTLGLTKYALKKR